MSLTRMGQAPLGRPSAFPQLEALDLARRRLGQSVDEGDPAGILPHASLGLDVFLEVLLEAVGWGPAGLQHDEGLGFEQAVCVLFGDDRRLQHCLVAHERALHLERRHPDARYFEHVVGAALVDVIALGIARVLVARARPASLEGTAAFLALVPVALRRAWALHQHLTYFA